MHILFLAPQPFYQSRGTPIAEKRLLDFLSSQGHRVDVLTYHEGEPVSIPNCRIIRIPRIPGIRDIRPGFSLKKLICDGVMFVRCLALVRRRRYELVHAVEEAVFMAEAVRRLYGIPFVYDMDSSLAQQLTDQRPTFRPVIRILRWFERLAVRRSLGVLTVCRALEETTRSYDKSKLIACVEDTSLLDRWPATEGEPLRRRLGVSGPLAMYVGNLQPYQGIDLMLRAFAAARAEVPDAKLVVVGGAAERIAGYRALAGSLGIADAVHFIGPRPLKQLPTLLAQADVLISPRLVGTNTPMKVYSYLDSGVAVLATRLPTHTQVMDETVGVLADPEPEPFAAGLVTLLRNPRLRSELGTAARERIRTHFSPEAAVRKLHLFYAQVQQQVTGAAS